MLVLSRKVGETLVFPESDVSVTVLKVRGNIVRLGVSAPCDLPVYREELWNRICRARQDREFTCEEEDDERAGHSTTVDGIRS